MIERRQNRRARLMAPVEIRPIAQGDTSASPIEGHVRSVSLSGAYCTVKLPCTIASNEEVICSIQIPSEQTRSFPFSRVQGRGWVVRAEPVMTGRRAGEHATDEQMGLVVAFAPDVTALSTLAYPY